MSAVKPKLNFATLENDASENHDRSSKSHAHKLISIRIAANSAIFISLFLSGVDIDPCGQTIAHTLYFFPIINITLKKNNGKNTIVQKKWHDNTPVCLQQVCECVN